MSSKDKTAYSSTICCPSCLSSIDLNVYSDGKVTKVQYEKHINNETKAGR